MISKIKLNALKFKRFQNWLQYKVEKYVEKLHDIENYKF